MAALTDSGYVPVIIDYRLVGLVDAACDDEEKPPAPHKLGHWLGTTLGNLYIENVDDAVVFDGRMRLETWDGPADFDPGNWQRSDVIEVDLPSGVLGVDQITMGWQPEIYRLPEGRVWQTRVAWRTDPPASPEALSSASILVQFWAA